MRETPERKISVAAYECRSGCLLAGAELAGGSLEVSPRSLHGEGALVDYGRADTLTGERDRSGEREGLVLEVTFDCGRFIVFVSPLSLQIRFLPLLQRDILRCDHDGNDHVEHPGVE